MDGLKDGDTKGTDMISLNVESNKNDTNKFIYQTENRLTDLKIKLMATKGETWGEG